MSNNQLDANQQIAKTTWTIMGAIIVLGVLSLNNGTVPFYAFNDPFSLHTGLFTKDFPITADRIVGLVWAFFFVYVLAIVKYRIIAFKVVEKIGKAGALAFIVGAGFIGFLSRGTALFSKNMLMFDAVIAGNSTLESLLEPYVSTTTTLIVMIAILAVVYWGIKFGTEAYGKTFGWIALGFYALICIPAIVAIQHNPEVFSLYGPTSAVRLMNENPLGWDLLPILLVYCSGIEALLAGAIIMGVANVKKAFDILIFVMLLVLFGLGATALGALENGGLDENPNIFLMMLKNCYGYFGDYVYFYGFAACVIMIIALLTDAPYLEHEAAHEGLSPRQKVEIPKSSMNPHQLLNKKLLWSLFAVAVAYGFIFWNKVQTTHEASYMIHFSNEVYMAVIANVFFFTSVVMAIYFIYHRMIGFALAMSFYVVYEGIIWVNSAHAMIGLGAIAVFPALIWTFMGLFYYYKKRRMKNLKAMVKLSNRGFHFNNPEGPVFTAVIEEKPMMYHIAALLEKPQVPDDACVQFLTLKENLDPEHAFEWEVGEFFEVAVNGGNYRKRVLKYGFKMQKELQEFLSSLNINNEPRIIEYDIHVSRNGRLDDRAFIHFKHIASEGFGDMYGVKTIVADIPVS